MAIRGVFQIEDATRTRNGLSLAEAIWNLVHHLPRKRKTVRPFAPHRGQAQSPQTAMRDRAVEIAVALMALAGLRKHEVCFARWEWVRWDQKVLAVSNHDEFAPKNRRSRTISMHSQLMKILPRATLQGRGGTSSKPCAAATGKPSTAPVSRRPSRACANWRASRRNPMTSGAPSLPGTRCAGVRFT